MIIRCVPAIRIPNPAGEVFMFLPRSVLARRVTAGALAGTMAMTGGCASYRPVDRDAARAAGEVRVDLTERGTLEMGPQIGAAIVSLDGTITAVTDSTVRMSLKQVVNRSGAVQQWVGEAVTIPLSYVNVYRKRTPSTVRSIALGAGLSAAAVAVALGFTPGNSGSGKTDGTGIKK
jgi:hypothetical protein